MNSVSGGGGDMGGDDRREKKALRVSYSFDTFRI